DEQWHALVEALGRPAWALEAAFSAAGGRRTQHDEIDRHLAAWCGERTGDEIVAQLWGAGVPVAKVMQPHDQATLAQLQFRGFFETVDHPVGGPARHSTLPM